MADYRKKIEVHGAQRMRSGKSEEISLERSPEEKAIAARRAKRRAAAKKKRDDWTY